MQHITMAEKSLLVGDQVADLLLEYAALLAKVGGGDTVKVHAVSSDGDEVTAHFLLNSGTSLMAETTHSSLPEPENSGAERYLRERLDSYTIDEKDLQSVQDGDPDPQGGAQGG